RESAVFRRQFEMAARQTRVPRRECRSCLNKSPDEGHNFGKRRFFFFMLNGHKGKLPLNLHQISFIFSAPNRKRFRLLSSREWCARISDDPCRIQEKVGAIFG